MKNPAESIKDRLKNHARASGLELNPVLEHFALSRFFARLSDSVYADKFILKGAQLFTLWADHPYRPTRDADFLSFGASDADSLKKVFNEICDLPSNPSDGLAWSDAKVAPIREDNIHDGVRIKLCAMLGKARIPLQVDVGFGDSVKPDPQPCLWQGLLEFPSISLLAYQPETVIAEKFHAAVVLGTGNSRMKDFYDLLWLSRHMEFEAQIFREAIATTFEKRETPVPIEEPIAFTEQFFSRQDKQTQWKAFLRKSKLEFLELSETINEIGRFIMPVLEGELSGQSWKPGQGWVDGT